MSKPECIYEILCLLMHLKEERLVKILNFVRAHCKLALEKGDGWDE